MICLHSFFSYRNAFPFCIYVQCKPKHESIIIFYTFLAMIAQMGKNVVNALVLYFHEPIISMNRRFYYFVL